MHVQCTVRPCVEYACCLSSVCLMKWAWILALHRLVWDRGTGPGGIMLCCRAISLNTSWYCIVELIYSLSVHRCLMLQSHLCHIVLRHIAALGGALLHTRMQAMHCCIAMGYRYWCCIIGVHCAGLLHHAVWFCNCA